MKYRATIIAHLFREHSVGRDDPEVPGLLTEKLSLRFASESMPEMHSPETAAEWHAYYGLLETYDIHDGVELLRIHRESITAAQAEAAGQQ